MISLRAGEGHQAADMTCQRQQKTSRNPWNRRFRRSWAFEIRCGTPDQASAPVRQGNRDEPRSTVTPKR